MTLPELIDRLERATEGSRELDRLIWRVAVDNAVTTVEPYTRSIDAAFGLFPEGAWVTMQHAWKDFTQKSEGRECRVGLDLPVEPYWASAYATTFPLAMSLAAMRARLAMEGGNG